MMDFLREIYLNVVLTQSPRSFFILAAVAVLFYRIPFADKILRTFHTLLHESGHAFAAMLTGGKNHRMELNSNMSGTTLTECKNKFHQFVVSLSGYPFASAFAYLGFFLILNNTTGVFHIVLLSVCLFQLLFNIRNTYGIIWSLLVCALLLLELLHLSELMWASGVVICSVVLCESMIMSANILFLSFSKPTLSGDAANLRKITGIHSGFWGLLFFVQALVILALSVQMILNWTQIIK